MKTDLLLSDELYNESAIRQAIADYAQLCKVSYMHTAQYYVLVFQRCKYDKALTISEFCNYVLDLMNCKE